MKALNRKLLIICISIISLVSLMSGCSLFVRRPAEPSLTQLSSLRVRLHDWSDDMDYRGLEQAVEQSVRYYRRLPPDKTFQYGEITYSPDEMIASLTLFMNIVNKSDGGDLSGKIDDMFLFFESRNADGEAFFTGYYEPLLEGSTIPTGDFTEPLYETPADLIEVNLGEFSEQWNNERIVGKLKGNRLIPYDTREEIVYDLSLEERAHPIVYVNEIELFFLQIQGSGIIKLQDGSLKRVNYAQKNGHPYVSVGKILGDMIPPEKMSLQSIKSYLYDNPDEVRDILSHNQSYVFFREVDEGPLGNIEVPLTPERSIAMDNRAVSPGGLVFIETELPVFENNIAVDQRPVRRFALVQDTGGAIRDHGRVDLFLGSGEEAEMTAGHLKGTGRVFLIVARKEYLKQHHSEN
jgi:membrane-bound lytic murein transglycosylase A